MSVQVKPVNHKGASYVIARNGKQFKLSRRSASGRENEISFTIPDALTVCNQLIDFIETETNK